MASGLGSQAIGGTSSRFGPDDSARTLAMSSAARAPWTRPFEEAIRGEPVRPVESGTGHFARGPETGQARPAVVVDRDAADHVMGARADGDRVAGHVEAEPFAERGDAGESVVDEGGVEVGQVEVDVGVLGLRAICATMARETSSRGRELGVGVILRHEPETIAVAKVRPFASNRLGDEVAGRAGDVEDGGVELHEFHVAKLDPRAVGDGVAIGRGDRWVGRLAEELPRPPGRQHGGPGPDQARARVAYPRPGHPRHRPSWVRRSMVKLFCQIRTFRPVADLRSITARINSRPVASPRA